VLQRYVQVLKGTEIFITACFAAIFQPLQATKPEQLNQPKRFFNLFLALLLKSALNADKRRQYF